MTKERLAQHRARLLWCVHILGPDELVAKESYEAAEKDATELREFMYGPDLPDLDVMCLPIVAVWPGSAEEHAVALKEERERILKEKARRASPLASHDTKTGGTP